MKPELETPSAEPYIRRYQIKPLATSATAPKPQTSVVELTPTPAIDPEPTVTETTRMEIDKPELPFNIDAGSSNNTKIDIQSTVEDDLFGDREPAQTSRMSPPRY